MGGNAAFGELMAQEFYLGLEKFTLLQPHMVRGLLEPVEHQS